MAQRIAARDFLSERRACYVAYTVCFAACALACFGWLYASGHCLIWEDDGVDQHFTFFCYFGTWMREATSSGTLPQWDYSLGYGSDIICTLASWIGEPFNLLSVLCPERYSEYLYQALVIVRLYLVGIAFTAYCRYHGREGFATLLGSLAYTFSGFCLVWGAFRHTMFIDPAIMLPWVLLGADKVLDGKRPTTLLAALAVTFVTYFYFAYMIVIFLVLYCLLRYFAGGGARSLAGFITLLGRFTVYVLASALVAGVLLAPIVMYVLQMGRLDAEHPIAVFHQLGMYALLPLTFAGGSSFARGPAMETVAVLAVAALCFGAPFKRDVRARQVKIALAVLVVFALFPFFGHVLNGFSYSTDRWMFALAMCVSYAIVLMAERFCDLEAQDWRKIAIVFALFALDAIALLFVWFNHAWTAFTLVLLVATYFGAFLVWKRAQGADAGEEAADAAPSGDAAGGSEAATAAEAAATQGGLLATRVVLMALLCAGIVGFANFDLASRESDSDRYPLIEHMARFGGAYEEMSASPSNVLAELDSEGADVGSRADAEGGTPAGDAASTGPFRFDKATELVRRNSSAVQDLYSVDLYASVYSQTVDDFRIDLAIPQDTDLQSHHVYTSDSRAALEAISSVKYFLKEAKDHSPLPFGFNKLAATGTSGDTEIEVWQTDNALPMAFTYDAYIPTADFESLDPLRRQQALLQGCALESSTLPIADVTDEAVEVPFTVNEKASSGVRVQEDGSILCTEKGGKLVLELEGVPKSETYVYVDNLNFTSLRPSELLSEEERASLGFIGSVNMFIQDHRSDTARDWRITFTNGDKKKIERFCTPAGNFYSGKHTWLVNTGYDKNACKKLTLTMQKPGVLTFDELKVLCQPLDGFSEQVGARAADPVTLQLSTNAMTGTVDAPARRLLYVCVPYSQGWSARVDGQSVEVKKANSGFMAIEVEQGSHEFEFTYETPYLKLGAVLSLIGIALCAAIIAYHRKRRPKRPQAPTS